MKINLIHEVMVFKKSEICVFERRMRMFGKIPLSREKMFIEENPSHPPAIPTAMQQIIRQVFGRFCPMFT
jgi:hypothetical protein